jgi:Na+/H+ antiporter NhaD/arsenite permease-like protein
VFRRKVHIGYLAAIVAASNAGGAGSVVGDTTTTMMWLDGVSPLDVLPAYVAAAAALLVFGIPASLQQQRYSPIMRDEPRHGELDWARLAIVGLILIAAIATNVTVNLQFKHLADHSRSGSPSWPVRRGANRSGSWCPKLSRAASSCSRWCCVPR